MKKIIPERIFDLTDFEKVCPAKNIVPLTTFDIDLFLKRHKVIIHIADEPYPFDVEITGDLEYCGKEDNLRLYKIPFGKQKNDLIFWVDSDNFITKILIKADVNNPAAMESFAGILVIILRNVGLSVEEIQAVNAMVQNEEDTVFHWCEETERFVFINAMTKDDNCYFGFFAAVE